MLVTPWFFLMSRAVSLNIPRRWWAKLGAPMPSATHIDGGMLAGACVALDKELENDLVVRNRAWRSSSVGAPWVLPAGLKCGPVDRHPLVVSPSWWMWNPCSPGACEQGGAAAVSGL